MNRRLSTGGTSAPEWMADAGWAVPWGYPLSGTTGALWVKDTPADAQDLERLHAGDWTEEKSTLVGLLHPDWTAPQYNEPDTMESWDTYPMPGGKFSAHYKFQHLPDGVTTAHPGWWIHEDGKARRAKGGEPVTETGGEYSERHVVPDLVISWDESIGVWRT